MAEFDREHLKRRRSVTAPWELMHFATDEVDAILAALERISELEQERDQWRERYASGCWLYAGLYANHQDGLRVLDEAGIPEHGPTKPDGFAEVYGLEQRVRLLKERAGLLETATRGLIDCHEYLAEKANANHESCPKVQAARAALGPHDASAPEPEGSEVRLVQPRVNGRPFRCGCDYAVAADEQADTESNRDVAEPFEAALRRLDAARQDERYEARLIATRTLASRLLNCADRLAELLAAMREVQAAADRVQTRMAAGEPRGHAVDVLLHEIAFQGAALRALDEAGRG